MNDDDFRAAISAIETPSLYKRAHGSARKPRAKSTRPNRHLEDDLSREVNVRFTKIFDQEHVVFYAVPNGGKRDLIEAVRLKAQGVKRGVYDWHLHWRNTYGVPMTGVIELKIGDGTRQEEQVSFGRRMADIGHRTGVARSIDEVMAWIRLWGVPHKS